MCEVRWWWVGVARKGGGKEVKVNAGRGKRSQGLRPLINVESFLLDGPKGGRFFGQRVHPRGRRSFGAESRDDGEISFGRKNGRQVEGNAFLLPSGVRTSKAKSRADTSVSNLRTVQFQVQNSDVPCCEIPLCHELKLDASDFSSSKVPSSHFSSSRSLEGSLFIDFPSFERLQ